MNHKIHALLEKYYKKFSTNKHIVKFGKFTGAKNLWNFDRKSVTKAIALGIACSWIPLPLHTTIAVFLAIVIDCNIPLVAVAIWFANPLTMPFMYYFAYEVGEAILHLHKINMQFHMDVENFLGLLHLIWEPFLLGCVICGLVSGFCAYILADMLAPLIIKQKS